MTSGIAGSLLADALKGLLLRPPARPILSTYQFSTTLLKHRNSRSRKSLERAYRSLGQAYASHPGIAGGLPND